MIATTLAMLSAGALQINDWVVTDKPVIGDLDAPKIAYTTQNQKDLLMAFCDGEGGYVIALYKSSPSESEYLPIRYRIDAGESFLTTAAKSTHGAVYVLDSDVFEDAFLAGTTAAITTPGSVAVTFSLKGYYDASGLLNCHKMGKDNEH